MKQDYKFHSIANQFPMMKPLEFEALKADIQQNGQQKSIILYEGKILDGRNRYTACKELGIEPEFEDFNGTRSEAAQLGISANLTRRHLSKSQISMFIAINGLATNPDTSRKEEVTRKRPVRAVAAQYGVTHVMVYKAFFVLNQDREIAKKVLAGDVSVTKAESIIRKRLDTKEQRSEPEPRERKLVKELLVMNTASIARRIDTMSDRQLEQLVQLCLKLEKI